jgi:hypothetical protein
MVARLSPQPPPPPPPLVPPPPSAATAGMLPPPLLPHPSPLLLTVGRATPWSASSPPAPPLALKVVGSQFADSTTGSRSPSVRSVTASCSRRRAARAMAAWDVPCLVTGRRWMWHPRHQIWPSCPQSRQDPPSPSPTSPPPPPAGRRVSGGSCLTVHGPRHR